MGTVLEGDLGQEGREQRGGERIEGMDLDDTSTYWFLILIFQVPFLTVDIYQNHSNRAAYQEISTKVLLLTA